MNWYSVFSKGHHGYPQPVDSYPESIYQSACPRCGIHEQQVNPVRLKSTAKAPHSDFVQPNWVFDIFLVRPAVEELLIGEGISSITFGPVIEHKNGHESFNLRQLHILEMIPCVETSCLPKVTCKPNNEESRWDFAGAKAYPESTPFCGNQKAHFPTTMAINAQSVANAPDLFQSAEWFGSGGSAFRATICNERFVEFVARHKLRGIGFNAVRTSGRSERIS